MTYWMTIALIVSLAFFVVTTNAENQRQNDGTDSKTSQIDGSEPSKSRLLTDETNYFEKRANFMPSRGKKEQFDSEKRASQGFLPMRGRKDFGDEPMSWYVGDFQSQNQMDEKRAGFMPMRGRKNSYDPDMEPSEHSNDFYPMELNSMKRMSSFMPMRGRKYDINYGSYGQTYGQTSPYGIPQPYSQSSQNIDTTNWMEGEHSSQYRDGSGGAFTGPGLEKKANAFFGARGKRSAINRALNDINTKAVNKRSVGNLGVKDDHKYNENFFATRG